MRYRVLAAIAIVGGVLLAAVSNSGVAQDKQEKPKATVKEVMKVAHKDGLLKKVMEGDPSEADKLALLDAYISLTENSAPKGSADDWAKKTNAVVIAAARVAVGRDGAKDALKAATNCAACHKDHKPS